MKGIGFARKRLQLIRLRITKKCMIGGQTIMFGATDRRELDRVRRYVTKEPQTVEWITRYVQAGDVFYDIGANIGLYSIFAAKRLDGKLEVYSFEPESQNYASLNKNVYLNGLSGSITTLCVAVSDSTRVDTFYVRRHMGPGESLHQFGSPTDDRGVLFSPVHRQGMMGQSLDNLCFVHGLPFPTHMKIDVDGHEASVVKGAQQVLGDPRLRSVLLEITEAPFRAAEAREIYSKFQEAGFSMLEKFRVGATGTESNNVIFVRSGSGQECR